jgi:hypothetical protein
VACPDEDPDGPVVQPPSAKPASAKPATNEANALRRMSGERAREKTIAEKAFRVDRDRGRDRKLAIFMDSVDPLVIVVRASP